MKYETGFSLIELITVIILLGIISVTALGKLDFKGFDERGFTDELTSALRYAQKIAVANNCATRISFSLSANITTASLLQSNDALPCTSASTFATNVLNPSNGSAFSIQSPDTLSLSSTSPLYFYADGSAEAASAIDVSVNSVITSCIHIIKESGYTYKTSGAC